MKLFPICICLLPCVLSTSFGSDSVVITGNDVPINGLNISSLTDGETYRVYAVYSGAALPSNVYTDNVHIVGADKNNVLTVFRLAADYKPMAGGHFLSDQNILTAPITITDPKIETATSPRTCYTIYIVSTKFNSSPVITFQSFLGKVDSSDAAMKASSCTVLSAEPAFQLNEIGTGSMATVGVKVTGYDTKTVIYGNNYGSNLDIIYDVLTVQSNNVGSFVTINGPIATLYNADGEPANFKFTLTYLWGGDWKNSMPHRARVSFLSWGWLNQVRSYNVEYPVPSYNVLYSGMVQDKYDYGSDTEADWQSYAETRPANGETVQFTCRRNDGTTTQKQCTDQDRCGGTEEWCRWVEVVVQTASSQGPKYLIKVQSGAFSSSMLILIVASLVGKLVQ